MSSKKPAEKKVRRRSYSCSRDQRGDNAERLHQLNRVIQNVVSKIINGSHRGPPSSWAIT
jgi:hypothetical protein